MKHKTINGWTKELMKAQIQLNMKAQSIEDDDCLYRSTFEGQPNACAVGCFIPDELNNGKFDDYQYSILKVLKLEPKLKTKMPLELKGLKELQVVHDDFEGNPKDCAVRVCKWIDENVEDA